jgi:hypothetical protein
MTSDGSADMAVTIPVPIRFRLPAGWRSVDPRRAGAPGAAFVAVHEPSRSGRVANITIGEQERSDSTALSDIADAALGHLVRRSDRVSLIHHKEYGSTEVPAIAQVTGLSVGNEQLVQYQVFLALTGHRRRVVIEAALTATPERFTPLVRGFGEFVTTIRLDRRAA